MIILGPVAVAENLVIGGDNDLPWYLPEDLKHFKKITLGKTVLMGRKSFDSIVKRLGKPLPERKNIVITRQKDYKAPEGVIIFNSLDEALKSSSDDIYIIGGAEIFKLALPFAEKIYITHVQGNYPGDAFFPEIDWSTWEKLEEDPHQGYTFASYKKKF
jgi:dihydrofolate reductase